MKMNFERSRNNEAEMQVPMEDLKKLINVCIKRVH